MEGILVIRECPDQQGICWPPLMELIRSMKLAQIGDVLAVHACDEESKQVIPIWLTKAREELVGTETMGTVTRFVVRKAH